MPAIEQQAVRLHGYTGLVRAFALADKMTSAELRDSLKEAAEPVRSDAESLARLTIRKMTIPWSSMRVGVTTRVVYVAPTKRGIKSRAGGSLRRPNLAPLLMGRAMQPALIHNIDRTVRGIDNMLATVGKAWERA